MIPILLTASVDTKGMQGAKFSAPERESMYVNTLNYYISDFSKRDGKYHLVFAENSGWDKDSILSKLKKSQNVSIEYISLDADDYDITKGKSYNEMLLLDQASELSDAIKEAGGFFKLTGRFPIKNVHALMSEVERYSEKWGGMICIAIAKTISYMNGCICLSMDMLGNADIMLLA